MMQAFSPRRTSRRTFLRLSGLLCATATTRAWALPTPVRALAFAHTHTSETLAVTYWQGGTYDRPALDSINHLLRDFRTGQVHPIEPQLLDYLYAVRCALGCDAPFEVISGYRSPTTNEMLQQRSGGVATYSLHMQGRAIDVRVPGVPTSRLREAAAGLKMGGVGYYASSGFVHLDTGRFRQW